MKAVLILALLDLGGCASQSGVAEQALKNLEGCERNYELILGTGQLGGSLNGSVKIHCAPKPPAS